MSDARKIYAEEIDGERWSGIQLTTAAGICTAMIFTRMENCPLPALYGKRTSIFEHFLVTALVGRYDTDVSTKFSNN